MIDSSNDTTRARFRSVGALDRNNGKGMPVIDNGIAYYLLREAKSQNPDVRFLALNTLWHIEYPYKEIVRQKLLHDNDKGVRELARSLHSDSGTQKLIS